MNNWFHVAVQMLGCPTTLYTTVLCQSLSWELQANTLEVTKKLRPVKAIISPRYWRRKYHPHSYINIHTSSLCFQIFKSNNKNWSALQKKCCGTYQIVDGKWRKIPSWTPLTIWTEILISREKTGFRQTSCAYCFLQATLRQFQAGKAGGYPISLRPHSKAPIFPQEHTRSQKIVM